METESGNKELESIQQSIKQLVESTTSLLKRMSAVESTQAALASPRTPSKGPSRAQSPAGAVAANAPREWLNQDNTHGAQCQRAGRVAVELCQL